MVHNGMCQVCEKASKDRSRVRYWGLTADLAATRCVMTCLSISWQKAFKIDSEDRPDGA